MIWPDNLKPYSIAKLYLRPGTPLQRELFAYVTEFGQHTVGISFVFQHSRSKPDQLSNTVLVVGFEFGDWNQVRMFIVKACEEEN